MKVRHKLNPGWKPTSDPVTDDYQAEIDATMSAAAKRLQKAVAAAERAELRAYRDMANSELRTEAHRLRAEAAQRWVELKDYEADMQGRRGVRHSGQGSVARIGNRGTL